MSRDQLFTRNGRYYHRQWIPLDLRSLYGERVELVKSLKTNNKKQAIGLASGLHQKYTVTFSLLRSGLLSPDQTSTLLAGTLHRKRNTQMETTPDPPPASLPLSSLVQLFTEEHSLRWTPKTQQEFAGQFKVLVSILGDAPVTSYNRSSCVTCRDTLLSSGKTPKTVNKYMTLLSSLFKWGVKFGHMERNNAEGLSLEIQQKPEEERKAYDREDIQKILRHLPVNRHAKMTHLEG